MSTSLSVNYLSAPPGRNSPQIDSIMSDSYPSANSKFRSRATDKIRKTESPIGPTKLGVVSALQGDDGSYKSGDKSGCKEPIYATCVRGARKKKKKLHQQTTATEEGDTLQTPTTTNSYNSSSQHGQATEAAITSGKIGKHGQAN
jgi:hypothetical protein